MTERAYPLLWPQNWSRTTYRQRARFKTGERRALGTNGGTYLHTRELTIADALDRLEAELDRLGAGYPVISTNIEPRLDGRPRSGQKAPDDPGVAVYFTFRGQRTVLACDRWDRVADNLAAVAAHIDALRGIERWGVGTMEQAFRGYMALPPPLAWRDVLGECATLDEAEATFRAAAKLHHPDVGGSHAKMAELTAAIAAARAELRA